MVCSNPVSVFSSARRTFFYDTLRREYLTAAPESPTLQLLLLDILSPAMSQLFLRRWSPQTDLSSCPLKTTLLPAHGHQSQGKYGAIHTSLCSSLPSFLTPPPLNVVAQWVSTEELRVRDYNTEGKRFRTVLFPYLFPRPRRKASSKLFPEFPLWIFSDLSLFLDSTGPSSWTLSTTAWVAVVL